MSRIYTSVKGKYINIQMRIIFSLRRRAVHKTENSAIIFDKTLSPKKMALNTSYRSCEQKVSEGWEI